MAHGHWLKDYIGPHSGGSGGGGTEPLVVTSTNRVATSEECSRGGTVTTYSHSWQEIYDALEQDKVVFLKSSFDDEEEREIAMFRIIRASLIDSKYSCVYLFPSSTDETVRVVTLWFDDAISKTYIKCFGDE